ncbi:RHS repeat-associated core domain-containing protein [Streptomyces sp. ITFR-6]|uniref:RHS repeat-associated core domain-containing protein n=1 Tax=Streptomyces sp. ITFR-6 TaxID=3075197 RepID=UPI002889686D|nr:RHS repeat-associated core domain-containing protein [Streptomyces sp. ITFR-6]WNI31211.1 RHS repeat-associated core domain-containing protein [Streptomyces sp. ITFR-6]
MSIEDKAKGILLKMGLWWPDANSGTLRSAATAWRTFAAAVDDTRSPANSTALSLIHHNKGESIDAFDTFWSQYAEGKDAGWLSDLSASARAMAKALEKFADAVDDAIHRLWEHICIDAAVIGGGVALAFITAGLASGAAVAAADAIIELGASLGVAVSTTIAEIAAETLVAAAFGSIESVTIDAAVAQPLKMAASLQHGFSLDEVNQAAQDGMLYGGVLGAGSGVLRAGVSQNLSKAELLMRPPSLRPDLVNIGPAARNAERTPCVGEPIDVATGAMLMTATDLTLPATLPLVFQRTHLSSYRGGVCFGPTWTSTLDECAQIDGEGVVFAAADGMRLVYPVPEPDVPTLPVTGPRWPLEWDGKPDGNMTVTDPHTGVVRTFTTPLPSSSFGTFHLPVDSWSDRNGNRIDVDRTDTGTPTGLRHSGGYYVAVDTDGPRVTALRLLDQAPDVYAPDTTREGGTVVMRYGYDEAGHLSKVINSSGLPLTFTHDDAGRMTKWTDRNGSWFSYTYDERGRVTRTDGIGGILSGTLAYDDAASTTTYTDSLGHTTTHRYNSAGQVVEGTDALGNTTRTTWDKRGDKPLTTTDPLGNTTRYTYDGLGRLTELTLPDGSASRARYEGDSTLPVEVAEADGARWLHAYDERGNRTVTTDPLGAETRIAYDMTGHRTAITNPMGATRRHTVNAAGLAIAVTDELGNTTTLRRDGFGRVVESIDPLGHITRTSWTLEGKPLRCELPDGNEQSWNWDAEGNLLAHIDPSGRSTQYSPGAFDILAARSEADGTSYAFSHDTELRLTGVTNSQGRTWTYTYDAAGRLTAETDFNGRTISYTYDAAGQLASRTNGADETLHFTRDAQGRITEQRDNANERTSYVFTPGGRLSAANNTDSRVEFRYDALGRVLTETTNGRATSYTYDAVGRRTSRTTPSGLTSHWAYDPAGRVEQLQHGAGEISFGYDAAGRETERRIGDSTSLCHSWDSRSRLTAQSLTRRSTVSEPETLLQHRTYAYGAAGTVGEIQDLTFGTRHFEHDELGRVSRVRAHGWSEAYVYDVAGNITRAEAPEHEAAGDRETDGVLVRSAGRTAYAYDGQGRLIRKTRSLLNGRRQEWHYRWSGEDRLVEVITPQGDCWHYAYDPLGRRISKCIANQDGSTGDLTLFSWDHTRIAEQITPSGRVTAWEYEPGTHRPLTQIEHPPTQTAEPSLYARFVEGADAENAIRFYAIITDSVGTPVELVDLRGRISWSRRTTLWGTAVPGPAIRTTGTATECPLRFPGQYEDEESGLHYNHFRYYDPETARYISPDPLGIAPGPNHYSYVRDPHRWMDPSGLTPCIPTNEDAVPGVVFRSLSEGEDPALGLAARSPGSTDVSPLSHVAGKRQSPWISTTKLPETAFGKYGAKHGVVAIDLSKIPGRVEDVSGGFPGKGRIDVYARKDQEVLVYQHIPPEAIIGYWP